MKMAIVQALTLLSLAQVVHAGECFYSVTAQVINERTNVETTFFGDMVELGYPIGSTKCNENSSGRIYNRSQKLEDQFREYVKAKYPEFATAKILVVVKWFPNGDELKFLYKNLSSMIEQSGKVDDSHRVIFLHGLFYKE